MSPKLAAVLCALFILYLFYTDLKRPDGPSKALWVPTAWMFLAGSRYVSAWLNLRPTFESARDYAEGSPIDRAVFIGLIVAGVLILVRRKVDWERVLFGNVWIVLYLLYCLSSVAWTDEPTILMKRWIKDLGNPIMALVILTERRPYEAIGVVLRRMAFVMLPLSILFIKYYPELGRWYRSDGAQTFTGVGTQKNDLGLICLISGIYVAWESLQRRKETFPTYIQQQKTLAVVLSGMIAWLLYMSNSQTSLVSLIAAVLLLLLGRSRFIAGRPARVFGLLFCAVMAIWLLDEVLGLKNLALSLLGRRPDLTERTDIWRILQGFNTNPIVGVGFMSFWTGARLEEAWKLLGVQINQAHNGYLEQYLNLGYIGVAFIVVIMLSGLLKVRSRLRVDPAGGMLCLCFIFVAALYNYTEASFYGMNNMWMLLLLGCLELPRQRQSRAFDSSRVKRPMVRAGIRYQHWPSPVQAGSGRLPDPPAARGADARGSSPSERA